MFTEDKNGQSSQIRLSLHGPTQVADLRGKHLSLSPGMAHKILVTPSAFEYDSHVEPDRKCRWVNHTRKPIQIGCVLAQA